MDVFSLLSYINKISLFAFFITTLVVGYQIYILRKEKTKQEKPSIPDFKEKKSSNLVTNFTILPSSLTKKETKLANYSKLFFVIISLLTVMVVFFVFILIKQNNSAKNQASLSPTKIPLPKPTIKATVTLSPSPTILITPSSVVNLSPTPIETLSSSPSSSLSPILSPLPTIINTSSTPVLTSTINPTEIILAKNITTTPLLSTTNSQNGTSGNLKTLPETGSWEKGLLIIGIAVSTIFFSFCF